MMSKADFIAKALSGQAYRYFVAEKLGGDEDCFEVEREREVDGETDEEKANRLLTVFGSVGLTDPIFRARGETREALAAELGGKRLAEGYWYFGFKGDLAEDVFERMTKVFGAPVSAAAAKQSLTKLVGDKFEKAARADADRVAASVVAMMERMKIGGGGGRRNRGGGGRRNGRGRVPSGNWRRSG
jgi:hypothetical protein